MVIAVSVLEVDVTSHVYRESGFQRALAKTCELAVFAWNMKAWHAPGTVQPLSKGPTTYGQLALTKHTYFNFAAGS